MGIFKIIAQLENNKNMHKKRLVLTESSSIRGRCAHANETSKHISRTGIFQCNIYAHVHMKNIKQHALEIVFMSIVRLLIHY